MPLTQSQIDAVNALLKGSGGVNNQINALINIREDLWALLRVHADIPDINATTVLSNAKTRGLTASQALVTLLT